jgi:ERCC4-type nuclease
VNIKKEFLENKIKHSNGTIEDYLTKEKGYRDIHFHNMMNIPHIHMKKYRKDLKTLRTFRKDASKKVTKI